MNQLSERWLTQHASSLRSYPFYQKIVRGYIQPAFGSRNVESIRRGEIIGWMEELSKEGQNVRLPGLCYSILRAIFYYAVDLELVQANPCTRIKAAARFNSRQKDRVLSETELRKLFRLKLSPRLGVIFRLILATCCRPGEISKLEKKEVDWKHKRIVLPKEKTKNKQEHTVHLSDYAFGLLEGWYSFKEIKRQRSPYVFLGKTKKGPTGVGVLANALSKLDYTPHDLRRTGATLLAKDGVEHVVIAQILNHQSTLNSITHVYQRYRYTDEVQAALDKLGNTLDSLDKSRKLFEKSYVQTGTSALRSIQRRNKHVHKKEQAMSDQYHLKQLCKEDLLDIAKQYAIVGRHSMNKKELVAEIETAFDADSKIQAEMVDIEVEKEIEREQAETVTITKDEHKGVSKVEIEKKQRKVKEYDIRNVDWNGESLPKQVRSLISAIKAMTEDNLGIVTAEVIGNYAKDNGYLETRQEPVRIVKYYLKQLKECGLVEA